jgi:hypothetical protein
MHDLRRNVGITSNEQVALVDDIMTECTSSVEARLKVEREDGGGDTVVCRGDVVCGSKLSYQTYTIPILRALDRRNLLPRLLCRQQT